MTMVDTFLVVILGVIAANYLYHMIWTPFSQNIYHVYCDSKEEAINFLEDLTDPNEK